MVAKSIFKGSKLARAFETDKDAEQNGVWRVHPEYGIHARIRRSTLLDHKRALRRHYKPFAHLPRVDPKDELLIKQKAAAEVLVADWGQTAENDDGEPQLDGLGAAIRAKMIDGEGNEIRPTQENVLAAFIEMPDFFDWVTSEADTFEYYRVTVVEEAAKNSQPSSSGSGSGELPAPPLSLSAEQPVASPPPPLSASPI